MFTQSSTVAVKLYYPLSMSIVGYVEATKLPFLLFTPETGPWDPLINKPFSPQ